MCVLTPFRQLRARDAAEGQHRDNAVRVTTMCRIIRSSPQDVLAGRARKFLVSAKRGGSCKFEGLAVLEIWMTDRFESVLLIGGGVTHEVITAK
jgi:hypothetical protein